MAAPKKWLSTLEAAELVEVSPSTIRRLIEEEELDSRRKTKSGPWLVSEDSVEDYLEEVQSGDRQSVEYEKGFDAGYDEGVTDADVDPDDDPDNDDDDDEDAEDDQDDDR